MPEITVVITSYNLENYIDACLSQLECQTLQNFEVLVVDDCSRDRTVEIVKAHQEKGLLSIDLISTDHNLGLPGRTRNFAMDSGLIRGNYVVFLDGDDNIEPDFLESLHAKALETGAEITLCAYDRFETETGHVLCHEMKGFPETIAMPPDSDILSFINSALWNKLILTRIIGSRRIPDFQVGEDLCFALELFQACTCIACIDRELIHYRVRGTSVISNLREETIYQLAHQLKQLWEQAKELALRQTLELTAFIHVGLSMSMRAYDNPKIQMGPLLSWITGYFRDQYNFFRGNPRLGLRSLSRHGIKGCGVWAALICYRLHCFPLFLWAFKTMTRVFHMDIKF